MNKLELAETLIAVADTGSIQLAATKLNQTNAAISKKLAKLEEHLNIQLATRHRKGIILTEAGQRYYHEAKNALEQFKRAEHAASNLNSYPHGELRVVTNQYHMDYFIMPYLTDFLAKYPDIRLTLDIAEILPDFNAKGMDILFGTATTSTVTQENLVQKKLYTSRYVLCASPGYLAKRGIPKTTCELLQHDFIWHCLREPANLIRLDNDEQIIINPKLCFNNTYFSIQAALAGLGIIWSVECMMVGSYLKNKTLVSILNNHTQQPYNVYAYYLYQKYQDPKIQAFLNFFKIPLEDKIPNCLLS